MGFPRQEYWSGLPFPPPEDLPNPEMEPTPLMCPALAGRFFATVSPVSSRGVQFCSSWVFLFLVCTCMSLISTQLKISGAHRGSSYLFSVLFLELPSFWRELWPPVCLCMLDIIFFGSFWLVFIDDYSAISCDFGVSVRREWAWNQVGPYRAPRGGGPLVPTFW